MNEHEATYYMYGCRVYVDKVGGGTVGRRYGGLWDVVIVGGNGDVVWSTGELSKDKLHTGTPKTHAEAGVLAMDFYQDGGN